jgi:hypothetical protein
MIKTGVLLSSCLTNPDDPVLQLLFFDDDEFHGWVLNPEGAQRAASMILSMVSSGRGSGLSLRLLRLLFTNSSRSS